MNSTSRTNDIAILATLDTKGAEAKFLAQQITTLGLNPVLIDVGVVGQAKIEAQFDQETVAQLGGSSLAELLQDPNRDVAAPIMAAGASTILKRMIEANSLGAVIGIGGTQGTSLCCHVMQGLPYGLPKIMVSTVASGDTSAFVGIKDITMMFSVCDLLGLNPLTRTVLANAASAACGMAEHASKIQFDQSKPVVAMTNLGVLTEGALLAQSLLEDAGFEVIVFHAVGSGGKAMEQMMKEGMVTAVFDYALGEISDELYGGLRASGPQRLTVARSLGLPQVIVPGGAEHLGLFVSPPHEVPQPYQHHKHVFHSPVIFVPRLNGSELTAVAESVGQRLHQGKGPVQMFLPEGGTSRYSKQGEVLCDPEADAIFFAALEKNVPADCSITRLPDHAEHPKFVEAAVAALIGMIKDHTRG